MPFNLARLLIGVALLSYAAYRDWHTRQVSNTSWALMGGVGLILLGSEIAQESVDPRTYLILLPIALMYLDAVWDRDDTGLQKVLTIAFYVASASAIILLLAYFSDFSPEDRGILRRGFGVLVVILLAYLFYYVGLLRGGADAKAFMSIGLLVPGYPILGPFPLVSLEPGVLGAFEVFFPFALTALMNSALLLLAVPVFFLIRNLVRGDYHWPQVLLGYKAPQEALPPFVWVLQDVSEGKVRYYVLPKKEPKDADLEGLRSLGIERVWVTPQIPFLIPMAVGYVFTFLVGNALFGLL